MFIFSLTSMPAAWFQDLLKAIDFPHIILHVCAVLLSYSILQIYIYYLPGDVLLEINECLVSLKIKLIKI